MQNTFDNWQGSGEELAHFGVRGMKWGQRRFQNSDGSLTALGKERYGKHGERSRLGIKHDLNKLDREQTNAQARYDYYHGKATKKIAKLEKKKQRDIANNDQESVKKHQAEIDKIKNEGAGKKAEQYKKLLDSSKKMTERIIRKANASGLSIKSRDCLRAVSKGRNAAISALATAGGVALAATTGVGFTMTTGSYAVGKHYRVVNDGLGVNTHRSRMLAGNTNLYRNRRRRASDYNRR